ncbi:DUF998 domain-containing protein [Roseomonas sp. CCTCC AB2023176]|uniref:DUF998 domain-containing protein n=1 Tax=Roseomonas sp. CCTCC AB2023176 TaxID=3342640 RepID=UPI0035DC7FD6
MSEDVADRQGKGGGRTVPSIAEQFDNLVRAPNRALRALELKNQISEEAAEQGERLRSAPAVRSSPRATLHDLLQISSSYYSLRWGLAILAVLFPVLLVLQGGGLAHAQASLSAYYHYSATHPTHYGAGTARDIFVGVLFAIGAFLVLYRGYSIREDWAMNVAGVAAIIIALCPMDWPVNGSAEAARTRTATWHFGAAAVFFLTLGVTCAFFSQASLKVLKNAQGRRVYTAIYAVLGMLFALVPGAIFAVYLLSGRPNDSTWVFWFEVAGILIFVTFWAVKSTEIWWIEHEGQLKRRART